MLTFNSSTYVYSDNGDLVEVTDGTSTQVLSWDEMSRLNSVVVNGVDTLEYKLDWNGRRVERNLNTAPTNGYAYDAPHTLAVEKNNVTGVITEYVTATTPNSVDYLKVGTDSYSVIKDHLGSPRLVVKSSDGSVSQRMDYNEWGNVTHDTSPGFQKFGYAGGLYDHQTKLVKFGAREYDGKTGRWLSKDPIGFDGGDANLYGYVMQDPVNQIDPSGLSGILGSPNNLYPVMTPIKPKSPDAHSKPSILEKATHLLNKKTTPQTEKQILDDFLDNVLDDKDNEYNHLNCPKA